MATMSNYSNVKYRQILFMNWESSIISSYRLKWVAFIVLTFLMLYFINVPILLTSNGSLHRKLTDDTPQIEELTNRFDKLSHELLSRLGLNKSETNITSLVSAQVQLNNSQTFKLAEAESNLALAYWEKWESITLNYKERKAKVNYCDRVNLTDPFEVKHNNLYWQQLDVLPVDGNDEQPITMFLFNAFYDKRVEGSPVVKLISANAKDHLSRKRTWWCLLWFDKLKSPALVKVSDYYTLMGDQPGYYHPQLITCPIPMEHIDDIPEAVSLQAYGDCQLVQGEPSNVLRVIYEQPPVTSQSEQSIGVCVQAFRFATYDVSVRLVEWLELVKLMGADKVNLYLYGANGNTRKVLRHYEKEGLVNSRPITLPGNQPNIESLYNLWAFRLGDRFWPMELVELNDCLYRNLYRHKYLAVIDIDEIIMPQKVDNWHRLIERIESKQSLSNLQDKAYYSIRHSHVCEVFQETERNHKPIPEYLYMMRHTYRGELLKSWQNVKCFHLTDKVTAVHNHLPIRCIGNKACKGVTADQSDAVLWHYRRNQSDPGYTHRNSNCPIHEHTVWRYYEEMQLKVQDKLKRIFAHD